MSKYIDLAALQPEPLEIRMPSGTVYNIPATVSVKYITKLMSLQAKAEKIKNQADYIPILQEIAFEILSLDKSKDVTLDTVYEELDDMRMLNTLLQVFNDHINGVVDDVIPKGESSPNTESPLEK